MKIKKKIIIASAASAVLIIAAVIAVLISADRQSYVTVSGVKYERDISEIVINDADFEDYGILNKFPHLKKVDLREQNITCEEFEEISKQISAKEIIWSIPMGSQKFYSDIKQLELNNYMALEDLSNIKYFTSLRRINLGDYPLCDELYEAVKFALVSDSDCEIVCSTSLYGVDLDNNTAELKLNGIKIEDTEELENVIRFFPNLKRIEMISCGLSNDVMGGLREKYPDKTFVWLISFLRYTVRTDAVIFSTLMNGSDSYDINDFADLFKYCTELRALDLGHHKIKDLSAIANLKKLRAVILTDNEITDISAFAELEDLEFMEMNANFIQSIEPLRNLKNLKYINIFGLGTFKDLSPLYDSERKPLKICLFYGNIPREEREHLAETYPDCGISYNASEGLSTNKQWRSNPYRITLKRAFKNWKTVVGFNEETGEFIFDKETDQYKTY